MADDAKSDVPSDGHAAPANNEPEAKVTCAKCDEQVEVSKTMSAGRVGRVCKLCYNANRALAEHFKRRGRKQEWDAMPPARRNVL